MEDFRKMVAMPYEQQQRNQSGANNSHEPHSPHMLGDNNPPHPTKPSNQPHGSHGNRGNRSNPFEKLIKQLKIILKLARIDAYNLDGQIKGADGQYMSRSDIIHLLQHSMTPGKLLIGEDEFVDLLHKANVEIDLIVNENVRSRLRQLYEGRQPTGGLTG